MKNFKFVLLSFLLVFFGCQKEQLGNKDSLSTKQEKQIIEYIKDKNNYKREFGNDFEDVKSKYQERVNGISVGIALKRGNYASLLNLTYSKKNEIYTKDIVDLEEFSYYSTYSTTKFENLLSIKDENASKIVQETTFKILKNKLDFSDLIEHEISSHNIVLRYFDEEAQMADIENEKFKLPLEYYYQTYIEKTETGYVAFNKEEILGTYQNLNELFEDNKVNPLPLRILSQLKFGNSSEKTLASKTGPWIEFQNESSIGVLTKKSEVFYKIELWNGTEKKGKTILTSDNGVLKKDSENNDVYTFDTAESIITFTDKGLSGESSYLIVKSKDSGSSSSTDTYNTQHLNGSSDPFNSSNQLLDEEIFFFENSVSDIIKKEFPYLKNVKISFKNTRFSAVATISGVNDIKRETHKLEIIKSNNNYVRKLTKFLKTPNEKTIKKGDSSIMGLL